MTEPKIPTHSSVVAGEKPAFGCGEHVVLAAGVHREREELLGHDLPGLRQEPGLAAVR